MKRENVEKQTFDPVRIEPYFKRVKRRERDILVLAVHISAGVPARAVNWLAWNRLIAARIDIALGVSWSTRA